MGSEGYLFDCEMRAQSRKTVAQKRDFYKKFAWWARTFEVQALDEDAFKRFFHYLATSHTLPEGRWGNRHSANRSLSKNATKEVSAHTRRLFRVYLSSLWQYFQSEGMVESNPLDCIPPVRLPDEQKEGLTSHEVNLLVAAARNSPHARRDEAIVRFFLSTGCRAAEVVVDSKDDPAPLLWEHIDLLAQPNAVVTVRGKGRKKRTVFFGKKTIAAMWAWKREVQRELERSEDERTVDEMPVFVAVWGKTPGEVLTVSGLSKILQRLGKSAGIKKTLGPHLLRHTFARIFLEEGGQEKALQRIMGHRHLAVTHGYVRLTDASTQKQHARCDPGERF